MSAVALSAGPAVRHRRQRDFRSYKAAAMVGLLGFLTAFIGSWVPSLWYDEIATITAANRTPQELLNLVQSVDAVHGLYYLLMHNWTGFFGYSEVSLRLPSAFAAAVACAGTALIGERLGSQSVGLLAGLVLAVMPRMVWAGMEARSYALTAAVGVVLTLIMFKAWDSRRPVFWALYILVAVIGVLLFMFFGLLVAAHVAAALFLRRDRLATCIGAAAVSVLSAPFIIYAMRQSEQVAWIESRSLTQNLVAAGIKQFFYGDDRPPANMPPTLILAFTGALALVEGSLVLIALVRAARSNSLRGAVIFCLCLVLVPMVALLAVGALIQPVYVARYLTFTAPAFAILVALGLAPALRRLRPMAVVAIGGLLVLSLLPQLTLKGLLNAPGDSVRGIAATLEAKVHKSASIVYSSPNNRNISVAYPDAFDRLQDLSLQESPEESGTLWGKNAPLADVALDGKGEVWYLAETPPPGVMEADIATLEAAGCTQLDRTDSQRLKLIAYECKGR